MKFSLNITIEIKLIIQFVFINIYFLIYKGFNYRKSKRYHSLIIFIICLFDKKIKD